MSDLAQDAKCSDDTFVLKKNKGVIQVQRIKKNFSIVRRHQKMDQINHYSVSFLGSLAAKYNGKREDFLSSVTFSNFTCDSILICADVRLNGFLFLVISR
jgi:hypothetical protein